MTTPELLEYIRSQLAAGTTPDAIREALVKQSGWNPTDVDEGLRLAGEAPSALVPPLQGGPTIPPAAEASSPSSPVASEQPVSKSGVGAKRTLVVALAVIAVLFVGAGAVFAFKMFGERSPEEVWVLMLDAQAKRDHMKGEIVVTYRTDADIPSFAPFSGPLSTLLPSGIGEVAGMMIEEGVEPKTLAQDAVIDEGWDLPADGAMEMGVATTPTTVSGSIKNAFSYVRKPTVSGDRHFAQQGDVSGDIEIVHGAFSLRFSGEMEYLVPGEEGAFVRFKKYPDLMPILNMNAVKRALVDRWVKIDTVSSEAQLPLMDEESLKLNEYGKRFASEPSMVILKELEGEAIDGVSTYHYEVAVDAERYIAAVKEILGEDAAGIPESTFVEMRDAIGKIKAHVWIGKKDFLLRKATMAFGDEVEFEGMKASTAIDVAVSLNPDEPAVEIVAPGSSLTMQEATERIMRQFELSVPGESNGMIVEGLLGAPEVTVIEEVE